MGLGIKTRIILLADGATTSVHCGMVSMYMHYYKETSLLGTGCVYAAICTAGPCGRQLVRMEIHYQLTKKYSTAMC